MSRPAWGAWIEIGKLVNALVTFLPLRPAWGAWIEMVIISAVIFMILVAPRMGRVD